MTLLSKSQLAGLIVGLIAANDADLIDADDVLSSEVCAAGERSAIRQLRDELLSLYEAFDYTETADFQKMIAGKSGAYRAALARRYSEPEALAMHREAYADALADLLVHDKAYDLTAWSHHTRLDGVRDGFAAVTNPNDNAA